MGHAPYAHDRIARDQAAAAIDRWFAHHGQHVNPNVGYAYNGRTGTLFCTCCATLKVDPFAFVARSYAQLAAARTARQAYAAMLAACQQASPTISRAEFDRRRQAEAADPFAEVAASHDARAAARSASKTADHRCPSTARGI